MENNFSFGSLLESSWMEYKSRAKSLALHMLWAVPIAFGFGILGVVMGASALFSVFARSAGGSITLSTTTWIIFAVCFVLMIVLALFGVQFKLSYWHLILKPSETISFWKRGTGQLLAFIGLAILQMLILFGGMILLVIPAILFYVWFVFAPQYFVLGAGITESLKKSRALVLGRWWRTALSLIGANLCVIIPVQLIMFLANILSTRFGFVVSILAQIFVVFFVAPALMIFMKQLREQLEAHREHGAPPSTDTNIVSA